MSISARVTLRSNVRLPRRMPSVTSVPALPLMNPTAVSSGRPASFLPLAETTTSPTRSPAFRAGEPS
jgi:hypothetical protein